MPQITGKVTEQIRAFFDEMREEMGAGNDAVVIAHLVKAYQAKESKQPAAAAVKSSEAVFYAKIDPRDQPLIKEMRDALYDAYNYRRDEAILRHFAKMNRSIDNQVIYLIKPPKNINELIQQKAQPLIDDGDVQDVNQFIVKELKEAMKPKKKTNW